MKLPLIEALPRSLVTPERYATQAVAHEVTLEDAIPCARALPVDSPDNVYKLFPARQGIDPPDISA